VLALCAMSPKTAAGQQAPRGQRATGTIGKPYPNPVNPETHIPIAVDTAECSDGSRQNVVTVRISNILAQEVAVPILEGGVAATITPVPPSLIRQPVSNLKLGCGFYTLYWGGYVKGTTKEAASG